jgi:RNA polymerase sigma factor (sigma-70 family)
MAQTEVDMWVEHAKTGDAHALEQVVEAIQGQVYNLAIRMLRTPADAEDATQEILIRIVTHLSEFRGESAFSTWVYRVASNTLLTIAQKNEKTAHAMFEEMGELLERSLAHANPDLSDDYDEVALTIEVRRSCTLGMLRCLDRDGRIALILGELFEISSDEAAYILDITPAAFRKRLSRARAQLVAFVSRKCGIVNPAHPCRCEKHIGNKIAAGMLSPSHLNYATMATHDAPSVHQFELAQQQELSALCRTAALMRAHPSYAPTRNLLASLQALITSPKSHLFENAQTALSANGRIRDS